MIFLKGIGIALVILVLLVAGFIGLISLVAGLCADLEHEQAGDDEALKKLQEDDDE